MPRPVIDAVAVTSRDMARTVAFYTAVGFDFDGVDLTSAHVEPNTAPGCTRLMIDTHELASELLGQAPVPANHAGFALLCAAAKEVDQVAKRVAAAGFTVDREPWDAPWGQRYCVLRDPDGYRLDLFAPLSA